MSLYLPFDRPSEPDIPSPMRDRLSSGSAMSAQAPERPVKIDPPEVVKRRSVAWAEMSVEIVQATRLQRFEIHSASPMHLLIAYEQGHRQNGETLVKGASTSALRNLNHKLTFIPADHEFSEWHMPTLLLHFTCFYMDPSGRFDLTHSRNLRPRLFFEHPVLWETVIKLKRLVQSASAANRHYMEAVAAVLCHELSHVMSGQMTPDRPVRGGLAAWQLRLVTEYIEKHLGEHVPLTALAALVRLSPHHFCRAFKQSLGSSPCHYQGMRRMERAKLILADPEITVAEAAEQLGYGATSVFTTAFRRGTGLTPTAYRRSLI
jgi:AraC-like DNA-binding protein